MRGDPRIEIGRIARAHGIRGEVVVVTHDPESTVLEGIGKIWIADAERTIVEARGTHRGWLVLLEGVVTRNDAEALRGAAVEIDRDLLDLDEDDVLLDDLIGCKVQLVDGTPWGEIVTVDAGPMQDLLVIHDGELERLLPLVDEFVRKIDLAAGVVTVEPPDGLPEHKK
ncbi:MAG TPA: ribosome maturation factor RimM [Kofleriaceae bacterium]|nr:ribosome maturation factor RimM [Kofleriaceae bacterium]